MMLGEENLSSILGWISIACWIVVYSPQVYENYSLQSGEGLSVLFVVIWLLGDLTNLAGALLADLLPTVIILAVYYASCDFILLFQIYHYRWKRNRSLRNPVETEDERQALISSDEHQRAPEIVPIRVLLLKYALALGFVVVVGTAAWFVTKGQRESDLQPGTGSEEGPWWWAAQILGWSSAVLFLGARIPQILKNFKTRCEGLSPALFFFSICGNTTYALSICAKSMTREYLIKNGGWLAGSALTVFLDIFSPMAAYPRIPAAAFSRRRSSLVQKRAPLSPDDPYVPHSPTFMSISYLRDAINAIDAKMATLVADRAALEAKLEQAVRLQAPVLRLPSELLSTIFTMGVLQAGDENPVMVPTLMLVCRYWADVALNAPELWSKIAVSPHDSLERAGRRLARSKSCPLDVVINYAPRMDCTNGNITEQVMRAIDLVMSSFWRIRSFTLTVPSRVHAFTALVRCQQDAPMLEHLTVQVYHAMQDDNYSSRALTLFNGCTPRLRSCSLTSFNFGWDLKAMTRLRVLKLGGYFNSSTPSSSTLVDILRQCPELEELAFRNIADVDSNPCLPSAPVDARLDCSPNSRIALPKLKSASFYYSGIAHTVEIMRHITFPNLESLELAYLENITPLLNIVYTQALTRIPLKRLRIESCLFSELQLINLLRKLPSLVTLELVDLEDFSGHSLKNLSSAQPWILPRLTCLTLDGCSSFDWDSLRTLIESRLPADVSAKRFPTTLSLVSSASAAAAEVTRLKTRQQLQDRNGHSGLIAGPPRLLQVDVTRCNQISKEMVQWLRMYVALVKCEPAKGVWGDPALP